MEALTSATARYALRACMPGAGPLVAGVEPTGAEARGLRPTRRRAGRDCAVFVRPIETSPKAKVVAREQVFRLALGDVEAKRYCAGSEAEPILSAYVEG